MHNELGLRNVTFKVDDLQAILDRLATDGYHLVGGLGRFSWPSSMADELLKTLEDELITIHSQYELDAIPGTHEDD